MRNYDAWHHFADVYIRLKNSNSVKENLQVRSKNDHMFSYRADHRIQSERTTFEYSVSWMQLFVYFPSFISNAAIDLAAWCFCSLFDCRIFSLNGSLVVG